MSNMLNRYLSVAGAIGRAGLPVAIDASGLTDQLSCPAASPGPLGLSEEQHATNCLTIWKKKWKVFFT